MYKRLASIVEIWPAYVSVELGTKFSNIFIQNGKKKTGLVTQNLYYEPSIGKMLRVY